MLLRSCFFFEIQELLGVKYMEAPHGQRGSFEPKGGRKVIGSSISERERENWTALDAHCTAYHGLLTGTRYHIRASTDKTEDRLSRLALGTRHLKAIRLVAACISNLT